MAPKFHVTLTHKPKPAYAGLGLERNATDAKQATARLWSCLYADSA